MERIKKIDYKTRVTLSYDPDDVNIRLQHFRISELVTMIDKNNLDILDEDFDFLYKRDLGDNIGQTSVQHQINMFSDEDIDIVGDDDLQRNSGLWNTVQKSQFIESLMIKLPVPIFYFDGSIKPWRVVDGLQRLHTIVGFIKGNFRLTGLEYLKDECDNKHFKNTPGYLRARILDAAIIAYVINPGTPPDVKYNIFKRINTGGLKLTGQEIRNAFFRGKPANFIKKAATDAIFKQATNYKVSSRRMIDREYVNRFIAFQIFDYTDYNGKMDLFLSEAMMDLYERSEAEFEALYSSFTNSMKRSYEIFDEFAFYRPKQDGSWSRQPNKALFDSLSWNLNEISENNYYKILNKKNDFKQQYFRFMNNTDAMIRSINDSTGSKTSVISRFNLMNNFITEFTK